MEYHRLQVKRIAKKTVALSRRPRMWFVTVTFLLLCAIVTGLFGLIAPNPFEIVNEPLAEALAVTEKFAADTGDVRRVPQEFWRALLRELNETLPGDKRMSLFFRLLSASMPTLILTGVLMAIAGLVTVVLDYGYCACCLSVFRREGTRLEALFAPFRRILTVLGTYFMVGVFCLLWVVSGIVIGVAAISVVSMTMKGAAAVLVGTLAGLAVFTVVHTLCLQYTLTPYVIAEYPDAGIFEVIDYSKRLMEGNRLRFLTLEVSFLGWYVLIAAIVAAVLAVGGIAAGLMVTVLRLAAWAGVLLVVTVVFAVIVPIPIAVWLHGFRKTAFAGFYHVISFVPDEEDEEPDEDAESDETDSTEDGEDVPEEDAAPEQENAGEEPPEEEEVLPEESLDATIPHLSVCADEAEEPVEEPAEVPEAELPAEPVAEEPEAAAEEEIAPEKTEV